ncbi:MAG: hypothetical protein KatS3mg010_0555 [Acidimicrobiia bacterium]|nr:MAG: hypothetical protein KatS3mg010_0555 [Acidimicrobiia bacterium]
MRSPSIRPARSAGEPSRTRFTVVVGYASLQLPSRTSNVIISTVASAKCISEPADATSSFAGYDFERYARGSSAAGTSSTLVIPTILQ